MKSAWRHLHDNPPAMVRLMARRRITGKQVVALTLREIAIASGMPLARVTEISFRDSWSGIGIDEAEKFCAACQFDPTRYADRNRKDAYNRACKRHRPFKYLMVSPVWETELKPLISRLRSRTPS